MGKKTIKLKPLFLERMKKLLKNDFNIYLQSLQKPTLKSIRCNTLKISPEQLKKRLENYGWKISQPFQNYKEIIIIETKLEPGELGRSLEHLLGYYYIQELSSMMPVITLCLEKNESVLDLCASPGSKTTQISANMKNSGELIANEVSFGRVKILASNLERCGAANTLITKKEGSALCLKFKKMKKEFDKILVDAPCSGEGTLRTNPKTCTMWNIKTINSISRIQKRLVENALEVLKPGGTLIYSTCTHAPEENEEVIDYILKKTKNIKLEKINLPMKSHQGLTKWQDKTFNPELKKTKRIYPYDSGSEGFFIAKIMKNEK